MKLHDLWPPFSMNPKSLCVILPVPDFRDPTCISSSGSPVSSSYPWFTASPYTSMLGTMSSSSAKSISSSCILGIMPIPLNVLRAGEKPNFKKSKLISYNFNKDIVLLSHKSLLATACFYILIFFIPSAVYARIWKSLVTVLQKQFCKSDK